MQSIEKHENFVKNNVNGNELLYNISPSKFGSKYWISSHR